MIQQRFRLFRLSSFKRVTFWLLFFSLGLFRLPLASGEESATLDALDSPAIREVKVKQLLSAAESAVKQENGKLAAELFQRLLDQPEDSSWSVDGNCQLFQSHSFRRMVNQQLGQLPEVMLAEYRSQYGRLAQQQLLVARRSGQTADFVDVATRFFHTPAGYEAANYVGLMHFDRSEFGSAARWFDELAASPAAITRQDAWLMQAALASARSGDMKQATRLLDRLSQGQQTVVMLGTGPVKASEWLSQSAEEPSIQASGLSDWTQLYGSAARVGTALGGDPILIPNWFLPLASSNTARNALQWLIEDLQDRTTSMMMIMASVPLVVDGKVIYRDLRGIRSVDIERGSLFWEGIEGVSPERILDGLPSKAFEPTNRWFSFQGIDAPNSPLANLLFRDGVYGLISSDGKQVFVIEDHRIFAGNRWGFDAEEGYPAEEDTFGLPSRTNRLVSYDLKTGRPAWSLGGGEWRESFDLPLAGSYFHGTPAIEGNELFLVAGKGDETGKGDEIRLWSLDRLTGAPRWSQRIADADTKIEADIGRRLRTSQVAVGNGLVVCPTTVGGLVAIDRLRQSVVWSHRYLTNQYEPNRVRDLGDGWSPSAPVIAGNSIVFTPEEEDVLLCVCAMDGHRIWSQPKGEGLYLAGVFEQRVLVVERSSIKCYRLSDGETIWQHGLREWDQRPSGRGVMVGSCYYLPLSNGELLSIDLETGWYRAETSVAPQQSALGNLAMHRGKLVSLSPQGMTVFDQRDALQFEIQKRLAINPLDPWGLLRSSEIQLRNHQYADALPLLRKIAGDQLAPEEQIRLHAALIESLSTVIRADVAQHGAELNELRSLATSPSEKMLYHELVAEKLLTEQKPLAAFETLCALADEVNEIPFARFENRDIQTRPIVRLGGRISDLWTATSGTERPALDERISEMTREASGKSLEACERIIRLFSFHPAANEARIRLVEWLVEAGDPGRARLVLQQLIEQPDRNTAAHAIERLARLMISSQQPADAVYYYEQLASHYADVVIRKGVTGAKLVADLRDAKELDFTPTEQPSLWPTTLLTLSNGYYHAQAYPFAIETPLPFFQQRTITKWGQQGFGMKTIKSGELDWKVPLRSAVRADNHWDDGKSPKSIKSIGHQLFFVIYGVLHAISPLEKRTLWTKSLVDQGEGSLHYSPDHPKPNRMLAGAPNDLLYNRSCGPGIMAIVQPNYLCIHGRRSLSVLDPQTGEELWRHESLPKDATVTGVIGNHEALFVRSLKAREEVSVYRALDGKLLEIPGVKNLLRFSMMSKGSSFLLVETKDVNSLNVDGYNERMYNIIHARKNGDRSWPKDVSTVVLRLHDPIAKSTTWQIELPPGTVVSPLGTEEIVAFQPDGQLQRIEVASGRTISMESIKVSNRDGILDHFLLADEDRIYLICNSLDTRDTYWKEKGLESSLLNATVFAWGRKDNRLQWQQEFKDQRLIVDQFSTRPVMLFLSERSPVAGRNATTQNLTVINKQTGQPLKDVKLVIPDFNGNDPPSIYLYNKDRYIDLIFRQTRFRLVSTVSSPPVAAAAPGGPPIPGR